MNKRSTHFSIMLFCFVMHFYIKMLLIIRLMQTESLGMRECGEDDGWLPFTCFHFYFYFLFCVAELYDFPSTSEFSIRTLLLCVLCVVKHPAVTSIFSLTIYVWMCFCIDCFDFLHLFYYMVYNNTVSSFSRVFMNSVQHHSVCQYYTNDTAGVIKRVFVYIYLCVYVFQCFSGAIFVTIMLISI